MHHLWNELKASLARRPLLRLWLLAVACGFAAYAESTVRIAALLAVALFVFWFTPRALNLLILLFFLLTWLPTGLTMQKAWPDIVQVEIVQGAPMHKTGNDYTYGIGQTADGRKLIVYGKAAQLAAGYHFTYSGPVSEPEPERNPGGFSEERWAKGLGASGVIRLAKDIVPDPAATFRQRVRHAIESSRRAHFQVYAAEPALQAWIGAFAGAGSGALSESERHGLSELSLAHLTSVSGLHVGFFLSAVSRVFAKRSPAKRFAANLFFMTFIYYLAGGQGGVSRAILMRLVETSAHRHGQKIGAAEAIFAAALLMLGMQPRYVLQTGYWLSVIAALAIRVLAGRTSALWQRRCPRLPPALSRSLAATALAQLAIWPWLVAANEVTTPLSLLANVLVSYPAQLLTIVALFLTIVHPVLLWLGIGQILPGLLAPLLRLLSTLLSRLSQVSLPAWLLWLPGERSIFIFILYGGVILYVGLRLLSLALRRVEGRVYGVTIVLLLCISLLLPALVRWREPAPELWFLDVGQGDCCLIRVRDQTILIDGGELGNGYKVIWPFMKSQGIRTIDLAILSHGHSDHAGGIADLLAMGKIRNLAIGYRTVARAEALLAEMPVAAAEETPRNRYVDSDLTVPVLQAAAAANVPITAVYPDTTWQIRDATLSVLPIDIASDDENDLSLQLVFAWLEQRVLFTGDATKRLEAFYGDLDLHGLTILKVAHHGSKATTSAPFLSQIKPAIAMISVGALNTYGHPADVVLENLAAIDSQIYRTDLHGAVRFKLKRHAVEVLTWRTTRPAMH